MIKKIFGVAILILIAGVAIVLARTPGYLVLAYKEWSVQAPLWFSALVVLGLIYGGHQIARLFSLLFNMKDHLQKRFQEKRLTRYAKLLAQALTAWFCGEVDRARSILLSNGCLKVDAKNSYLLVAKMEMLTHDYQDAQQSLTRLRQESPEESMAIDLTQAEIHIAQGQYNAALSLVYKWYREQPYHPQVLYLLQSIYRNKRDWQSLKKLLPRLKHHGFLSADEYRNLVVIVYVGLLDGQVKDGFDVLQQLYSSIPREYRHLPQLVCAYAQALIHHEHYEQAEKVVRDELKREFTSELAEVYGEIKLAQPEKQLAFAEKLLSERPGDSSLLLTLGRLSEAVKVFGKAESYYQQSLEKQPSYAVYYALYQFYMGQNKLPLAYQMLEKANQCLLRERA